MEKSYSEDNTLLYFSFNQNSSSYCIGTDKGYTIYKSVPLNDYYIRELNGGVGIISMFNNSNILALVGGGKRPFSPQNKLVIWNDATSKTICEITVDFKIKNIKIKDSLICIIGENKIKVYYYNSLDNVKDYKEIDNIETLKNKNGIFGLNLNPQKHIISHLSKKIGEVIIKKYSKKDNKINSKNKSISAHQSEITCMSLNYDGDLLASCSEKGTIIRLFSTSKGELIKELRRGTDYAEIYSLNFDLNSQYLICSSSKGTIHIFNVKKNEGAKNPKSFLSSIGSYLNIQNDYLKNEWSFSQYHIDFKGKNIVSFCPESNNFVVLTENGMYYRSCFSPSNGGECGTVQKKDYLYLEIDDDIL